MGLSVAVVFRVRIYVTEPRPWRLYRVVCVADVVLDFKPARAAAREVLDMGPVLRLHVKGRFWWHPVKNLPAFRRMHDSRPFDTSLKRWRLER